MFAESKLIIESENCPDWHPPPSVLGHRGRRDNYRHNKHVIKRRPVSFDFQTDLNLWPLCSSLAAKLFETRFAFFFSLQVFSWFINARNVRKRNEDDEVVTWTSWQWRVSVRCDVWQGTDSRWSPHSWQCPRDILFVSSNCQEFRDNTDSSGRLIRISVSLVISTHSLPPHPEEGWQYQSLTFSGALQMFSEYTVQMSKYSQCPFCSAKNRPGNGGYWSGTVCIVAHLIIETQGPHPELVSCHEGDNGWGRHERSRHQWHLALHCQPGTMTPSVSISDASSRILSHDFIELDLNLKLVLTVKLIFLVINSICFVWVAP